MAAVIATRGLTKDFGNRKGLFDLDLEVEPGTVHGFLGPNGAGKSTLLRLLLDFLRPTRGHARIFGQDCQRHALNIRQRVGYLPGEISLPEALTGWQFLEDSAAARGIVDEQFRAHLVRSLGAQVQPKIRTLSKGNKQKLAFVDALQHRPELLILDEPTDGLDPVLRHRVHDILVNHTQGGGTVFLSSHVVHEIQTTCDVVSIVINGRLTRSASIDDLLAAEPTRVRATIPTKASVAALREVAGVRDVLRSGSRLSFKVEGPILGATQELLNLKATDVHIKQQDLEDTFLRLYQEDTE